MRIKIWNKTGIFTEALLVFLVLGGGMSAGPRDQGYIWIYTDDEAVYALGDTVYFRMAAFLNESMVTDGEMTVELTLDGGRRILQKTIPLGEWPAVIAGTLNEPGFLRCKAKYEMGGEEYSGIATVGFEPELIEPTAVEPDDFDEFWRAAQKELASIPLDLPDQKSYKFSFANVDGTRCYGFLSVPLRHEPPYPLYVTVDGAGFGPYQPFAAPAAAMGVLGVTVSVHDIDCGQPREDIQREYRELTARTPYAHLGAPDRRSYYFRRAILGVDRVINYMVTRDDFDGEHVVFTGSSQGGAIGLILAAINPHITAVSANQPALCEHSAGLAGRSPGWPQLLRDVDEKDQAAYLKMAAYYDVVNFARKIECPVIMSVGYNDETCPPSSVYAAYNVIESPKRMFSGINAHHQHVGEFLSYQGPWVKGQLGMVEKTEPK